MTTGESVPVRSDDVVQLHIAGQVRPADVEYARMRIGAVAHHAHEPILSMRIKLTRLSDPALARPMLVQVNVDLNGRLVRAQVARATMREAVDEAHDRVRDRLQREARNWEAVRGAKPVAATSAEQGEWRRQSVPTDRPQYFPRPADEREVVRHKAYALSRMTVDEAAFDMTMLDYDFHLFTEDASGVDSVLYRTAKGYRLGQLDPQPQRVAHGAIPYTASTQRPPRLRVGDAVDRLALAGWPFVFFRDAATGRGAVVYHRYDGHYGLIQPAENR